MSGNLIDWMANLDYPVYRIKKRKRKEKVVAKGNERKKHQVMVTVQFDRPVSEAEALRLAKYAFTGSYGTAFYKKDGGFADIEITRVSRPAT